MNDYSHMPSDDGKSNPHAGKAWSGNTPQGISELHKAALEYAKAGVPVFPIKPGGKKPAVMGSFKNATTDPAIIDRWWAGNPNFNIGCSPESIGCAVIDIDPRSGGDAAAFPPTFTVTTPSIGQHLYYVGSVPTTAQKLAPGVDTRGIGGYVLVPPSIVDGRPYVADHFPPSEWDMAPLPAEISARLASAAEPREAPDDVELDKPIAIEEAKRLLAGQEKPVEHAGSDDQVYRAACKFHDLGISDERASELLQEWTGFDHDWIEGKVLNVYGDGTRGGYAQNEIGSDVPKSGAETFGLACLNLDRPGAWPAYLLENSMSPEEFAELSDAEQAEHVETVLKQAYPDETPAQGAEQPRRSRFKGLRPSEYANKPELEFWDDERTLPKFPDGAVLVLYGAWGAHKTSTALAMVLDAIERGARVVYAAGEGAYGVGKERIPAHCRKRGVTVDTLDESLRIVPAMPLFAAADDVAEFIEDQRDFNPSIVALDTLATATAGEDENSSRMASFLTANGPVGRIRSAYNALVIILAHQGKDASRGIRGHSGLGGNIDASLHVEHHDSGALKLTVEKMRDGRDGHSIYFQVPPKGAQEVPVPVRITKQEYEKLIAATAPASDRAARVEGILRQHDIRGGKVRDHAWMSARLADLITGSEYAARDGLDAPAEWHACRNDEMKALKDAATFLIKTGQVKAAWARRLTKRVCGTNGIENVTVWCLPGDAAPAGED